MIQDFVLCISAGCLFVASVYWLIKSAVYDATYDAIRDTWKEGES
jgi:hypothetical protein